MGSICQNLSLSAFTLCLSPTVRMMFLPRLTLFMFIAFLSYCCNTQVKADGTMRSCKSVEDECHMDQIEFKKECEDGGKKCHVECFAPPEEGSSKKCDDGQGGVQITNNFGN